MIEFIPLASSSAGCAYLVKAEGHQPLLIDCGLAFAEIQKRLWRHGVNVSELAGCLISHGHLDHCKAAAKLMADGIDCYASREAWQHMGLAGHRAKDIYGYGDHVWGIGEWNVVCFRGIHDEPGTLGFLVREQDSEDTLLYITDSAYCLFRFKGLTHICIECNFDSDLIKESVMSGRTDVQVAKRTIQTHSSIDRVEDMLAANDLSRCREIHLLHLSAAHSDAGGFRNRLVRRFGIPVFVAAERGN